MDKRILLALLALPLFTAVGCNDRDAPPTLKLNPPMRITCVSAPEPVAMVRVDNEDARRR